MKIRVIFPTRGRNKQFKKVFNLYYNLQEQKNDYFVIADYDDKEKPGTDRRYTLDLGMSFSKIHAINRGIKYLKDDDWDILVLASDDMVPQVKGWDTRIIKEMKKYYPDTDGILWFHDGYRMADDINTLSIMGRKYFNRFGFIYNPAYGTFRCDCEYQKVAGKLGKYTFFKDCIIKHKHLNHKSLPADQKDDTSLRNEYWTDEPVYNERKKKNFDMVGGEYIKPTDIHLYNEFHLGDCIFLIRFLRYLIDENPKDKYYLYVKADIEELKPFVGKKYKKKIILNLIYNKPENAINTWIGKSGFFYHHKLSPEYNRFYKVFFENLCLELNRDFPKKWDFFADGYEQHEKYDYDVLIINSDCFSNQCNDPEMYSELNLLAKKLSRTLKVVSTKKIKGIPCTRNLHPSLYDISIVSMSVKAIIGVITGPMNTTLVKQNKDKYYAVIDKTTGFPFAKEIRSKEDFASIEKDVLTLCVKKKERINVMPNYKSKVLFLSLPGLQTGKEPLFPLGIGYLISSIKQDRSIEAVHYQVLGHAFEQLPKIILDFQPDIVGISCSTFNRGSVEKICRWFNENHPQIKIVLGGVHVSFLPEQALVNYGADYVVIGEGELTFKELCNSIDGKVPLKDVKGIAYLDKGQVVIAEPRERVQDLDELPLPDFSFASELIKQSGIGFVITSRGCPVRCHFCSSGSYWGQKVRVNSPRRVVDMMEALMDDYGVKKIFFHDDTFNLSKKRVNEICDEIMARGLKVEWGVSCRVHPVSEEMIDKMVNAGCKHFCWGIETGSKAMLLKLNKKITQEQIKNAYELCRKHLGKISVGAFTMIGNPGDDEETVKESIEFINTLPLTDCPSTSLLYVLPGTQLYFDLKKENPDIDNFWIRHGEIMFYEKENPKSQLRKWAGRISNSGEKIDFDIANHFWNNILFGEVPKPVLPKVATHGSELDHIIPPEIKENEFYSLIKNLASIDEIKTVLEIGSSGGDGSTEAFVLGLSKNLNCPKLFCIEISKPRYDNLLLLYPKKKFISCYNVSSVPLSGFSSKEDIESFIKETGYGEYPLEIILKWLAQDIEYVKRSGVEEEGIELIKRENNISVFDMVLIDGSEFTASAELDKVYGAKFILLDDINSFKNHNNFHRLVTDSNYDLIEENRRCRNGYSVFKKNN